MNFRVQQLPRSEVYRDFARIPEQYRQDKRSLKIAEGEVFRLVCNNTSIDAFLIARGNDSPDQVIRLDERTRDRLKVKDGQEYDFELQRVDFCGQLRWALMSSDMAVRFPALLAVVSILFGIVGFIIGVASIWLSLYLMRT